MLTRREFVQTAGAASLALATTEAQASNQFAQPKGASMQPVLTREPAYLGGNARYWLARLCNRNVLEYDRLDEMNGASREQVYDAVAAFGERVVPDLRRMLFRRPGQGRAAAFQVLSRLGALGAAVLVEASGDPRGYLRAEAVSALAHGFPRAAELPSVLFNALDDEVGEVRRAAARSLWCLGTAARPLLEQALHHADPVVRREAVQQVLRIDTELRYAKPLLLNLLEDADLEVRWRAVENLFANLPADPRVVPAVRRLIREGVVVAANYLPFAGSQGVAELLTLLKDGNVLVRAAAASTLAEFVCGTQHCGEACFPNQLTPAETDDLKIACQLAAQDNDLAVRMPAERILAAFQE